jgi:hypothetical protein
VFILVRAIAHAASATLRVTPVAWRVHPSVGEMSVGKKHDPAQIPRTEQTVRDESSRAVEARTQHKEMSHAALAALAAAVVVIAALVLVSLSRQLSQHRGAVLALVLGVPTLTVLAIVIGVRRREHARPDHMAQHEP